MVLLDVVYNHFGPDGNYLHAYCAAVLQRRAPDALGRGDQLRRRGAAARCATSSSTTRSTGSRSTTSTACASTRCTRSSTTRAPHILDEICARAARRPGPRAPRPPRARERRTTRRASSRATRRRPLCRPRSGTTTSHHALHVLAHRRARRLLRRLRRRAADALLGARARRGLRLPGRALAVPRRRRARRAERPPAAGGVRQLPAEPRPGRQPRVRRAPRRSCAEPRAAARGYGLPAAVAARAACCSWARSSRRRTPFLFFCDFGAELARGGDARAGARVRALRSSSRRGRARARSPTRTPQRPSSSASSTGTSASARRTRDAAGAGSRELLALRRAASACRASPRHAKRRTRTRVDGGRPARRHGRSATARAATCSPTSATRRRARPAPARRSLRASAADSSGCAVDAGQGALVTPEARCCVSSGAHERVAACRLEPLSSRLCATTSACSPPTTTSGASAARPHATLRRAARRDRRRREHAPRSASAAREHCAGRLARGAAAGCRARRRRSALELSLRLRRVGRALALALRRGRRHATPRRGLHGADAPSAERDRRRAASRARASTSRWRCPPATTGSTLDGPGRRRRCVDRRARRMLSCPAARSTASASGGRRCSSTRCARSATGASATSPICAQLRRAMGGARRRRRRASIRCTRCSRTTPRTRARTARRRACSSTCSTSTSRRSTDFASLRARAASWCTARVPGAARRAARGAARRLRRRRRGQARGARSCCTRTSASSTSPARSARARSAFRRFRAAARRRAAPARAVRGAAGALPCGRRRASGAGRSGREAYRDPGARRGRGASPRSTPSASSSTSTCSGRPTVQLARARRALRARSACGVGLYLDLAVSIDRAGAETWANQRLLRGRRERRRAARRIQPQGPELGPAAAAARAPARRALRALHRDAARQHAPRRRAAHRPRDGADAPVLDPAGRSRRATAPTCTIRSTTCSPSSRSRASATAAW